MGRDQLANVAASVRQRLLNRTRAQSEDYQVLLTRYALERFLYRLSQSPYQNRFVVKGAMLFLLWEDEFHRPRATWICWLSIPVRSLAWKQLSERSAQ